MSTVQHMQERVHERMQSQRTNLAADERLGSMMIGGVMLAQALRSQAPLQGLMLAGAGYLLYRGATGNCMIYNSLGIETRAQTSAIRVRQYTTVNRPIEEVYTFWHDFANLPNFMYHLESVTLLGEGRSHWVTRAPLGKTVSWDAQVTDDRPNELIAWQSLPDSMVSTRGQVRFKSAPEGRGTEVAVLLDYDPPGGTLGAAVATLFGEGPAQQVQEDVRRFKQILEAGEVATIAGQPSGPRRGVSRVVQHITSTLHPEPAEHGLQGYDDRVDQEMMDSFPASDPPSWTTGSV